MIGNWVIIDEKPRQVQSITKKKIGFHYRPNENRMYYARYLELLPIELTHDMLHKAGFRQDDKGRLFYHDKTGFELFYLGGQYVMTVNCAEYQVGETISYLHQLQNLFYNIERKRLKIEFHED